MELQISNPEVEENEEILLTYFKAKFRNHIKDKVRKQESDKRKLNKDLIQRLEKLVIDFDQKNSFWMN